MTGHGPSHELEQSLLGCLLLRNSALAEIRALVAADDFAEPAHHAIFGAAAALIQAGEPADVITVHQHLQSLGKAEEVGGLAYLNALQQSVPDAQNAAAYARRVREHAGLRQLRALPNRLKQAVDAAPSLDGALNAVRELVGDATPRAAAAHAGPRPRTLDFTALCTARAPARHWFRPGWLHAGVTGLYGKGGDGKSTLVQHEPTCGALGRPFFTAASEPYTSLVWNCEDDHDELWRRQEAICDHEGVDMRELAGRLHLVSRQGCDNALMVRVQNQLVPTRLFEELREQVNDLAIDALWLDNAAHVFLGDHDDRTEVTRFINALNGLVGGRPFAVVLVGHTARAQGSEFTGSAAWENAARMRWYLGRRLPDQRPEDDEAGPADVRYLAKRKANYSAQDYVRFRMAEGLLVPDVAPPDHVSVVMSAIDERRADEMCVAGFKSLRAMGIQATDGKTSPDYLPSQLVAKSLAPGFSKADLGKAMNRLMARGVFVRAVVGRYPNRSPKFGLQLQVEQV